MLKMAHCFHNTFKFSLYVCPFKKFFAHLSSRLWLLNHDKLFGFNSFRIFTTFLSISNSKSIFRNQKEIIYNEPFLVTLLLGL